MVGLDTTRCLRRILGLLSRGSNNFFLLIVRNALEISLNFLRRKYGRNKEKITQYDIDRAEKLLQVEQARIALEDARSSKTSMQLRRDSQGNYSYEYVADQDSIIDAQQNLAAAQNDLYNFDKDAYKANLEDILAAYKDYQDKRRELDERAKKGD
mgnify:CR=1 FL=1